MHPPQTRKGKRKRVQLLLSPCHYCGKPSETIDHLTPLSRGGSSLMGNEVPCCYRCNQTKGSMTELEFVEFVLALPDEHPAHGIIRGVLIEKARRNGVASPHV